MTSEKNWLKLGWGEASMQAGGPMTVIVILFLCLAVINGGMVLYHHWGIADLHAAMTEGLKKVQSAQDKATEVQEEGNYIHTLNEQERNALCLEMPASLKAKLKANGISHSMKRC